MNQEGYLPSLTPKDFKTLLERFKVFIKGILIPLLWMALSICIGVIVGLITFWFGLSSQLAIAIGAVLGGFALGYFRSFEH